MTRKSQKAIISREGILNARNKLQVFMGAQFIDLDDHYNLALCQTVRLVSKITKYTQGDSK